MTPLNQKTQQQPIPQLMSSGQIILSIFIRLQPQLYASCSECGSSLTEGHPVQQPRLGPRRQFMVNAQIKS